MVGTVKLRSLSGSKNAIEEQVFISHTKNMQLTSPAFEPQKSLLPQYTCDGEGMNPPLSITDVPANTKSLVLIMDDPDVPAEIRPDRMWDHWIVFNIPPDTSEIPEGQEPAGVHGEGTSGNLEYHGPCPPDGEHRYFFKLYAIDTMLGLSEGVHKVEVEQAMEGHVIEQTELVGVYDRKK